MEIKRSADIEKKTAPEDYFTGEVHVEALFQQKEPGRAGAGRVTFSPGARSAWHTHPCGQGLIITEGKGWTQAWGEAKVEINAGDVLTCPAGKKHWHGATATTGMTHIAVQEMVAGKNVEWMEKVTDEQYLG